MREDFAARFHVALIATALATCIGSASAAVDADQATDAPAATRSDAEGAKAAASRHSPFRQTKVTEKAKRQYVAVWGVDRLRVNSTNDGNLIRFGYRVEDPVLAKPVLERSATPYMYSPKAQVILQVPVMEKVGPLRQAMAPKAGQEYWVVFSNKGHVVKPGDRVDIRIGSFHADGLMVE